MSEHLTVYLLNSIKNNMKNTYIVIIVLVLAAIALFFGLSSRNSEAPTNYDITVDSQNPTTGDSETPAPVETVSPNAQVDANINLGLVKEFTVSGDNFSFSPSTMTVKKGDKVRITFKNIEGNHDLKIDELGVDSGIIKAGEQKTIEFTATKTGSFEYYCSVGSHRAMGMKGTLKVE